MEAINNNLSQQQSAADQMLWGAIITVKSVIIRHLPVSNVQIMAALCLSIIT